MKHSVRVRQSTCKTIAYTITHTLCEMMDEVGPKFELREHSVATMLTSQSGDVIVTVSAIFDEKR